MTGTYIYLMDKHDYGASVLFLLLCLVKIGDQGVDQCG